MDFVKKAASSMGGSGSKSDNKGGSSSGGKDGDMDYVDKGELPILPGSHSVPQLEAQLEGG